MTSTTDPNSTAASNGTTDTIFKFNVVNVLYLVFFGVLLLGCFLIPAGICLVQRLINCTCPKKQSPAQELPTAEKSRLMSRKDSTDTLEQTFTELNKAAERDARASDMLFRRSTAVARSSSKNRPVVFGKPEPEKRKDSNSSVISQVECSVNV
ncbi:hypothetical protein BOX15_Mlig012892g1 [Macrostomum lignano]|uniref:Uncharacterized protein n=1 Tax=Macrostomum lignano TaxID=282301 RepID=A0A267G2F1_9PLAT|nr:hypothetical protein BOX15_Mlig012892g1 [Macrostomum lignano]